MTTHDGDDHEQPAARYDAPPTPSPATKISKQRYESELARLQIELVKLQSWVKHTGQRICVIFEGRDAAGKGGTIKRIVAPLNPRVARVVALPAPSDAEKTQWYFQRYVAHLPRAGELVLFDRSWYNRAGVERVMGYASYDQVSEFLRSAPEFERMLIRDGIRIVKYWFSVSPEEQEARFQSRSKHPSKRWKLSPMDVASRARWDEYSKAKDDMFRATDTPECPWYVVESNEKKRARLNCIHHLLACFPYEDHIQPPIELPPRDPTGLVARPPYASQRVVPRVY